MRNGILENMGDVLAIIVAEAATSVTKKASRVLIEFSLRTQNRLSACSRIR
jgi:hypothetical protein